MTKTRAHKTTTLDHFDPHAEKFEEPLRLPIPKECTCGVVHVFATGVMCKKWRFYFTCANCETTMVQKPVNEIRAVN